jgi:hypothetical protein
MNKEHYQSLNEAYQTILEQEKGVDLSALTKAAEKAGKETIETGKDYSQGLFQGKKISSKAPAHARVANAMGRMGNKLGGGALKRMADLAYKGGKAAYNVGKEAGEQIAGTGQKTYKGHMRREEIEAILNSPHLTEEEREAFIAMIGAEYVEEGLGTAADKLTKGVVKKTAGQVARGAQKAVKTGAKVGHKIADAAQFGAGATYQLGKNILSKEEFDLDGVLDAMCEGLPEPKVHWKKDMDPYDPRRPARDHAPGSPLPPGSYRPGLPNMKLAKASKNTKDERKPKTA